MEKQDINKVNFSLKGYTSIQIGVYFLLAAFVIKKMLDDFLIDSSSKRISSVQVIEVLIFTIITLTLLFSFLALFFKGKRMAKQQNYKLWNSKTKTTFWKYTTSFFLMFLVILILNNLGFVNFITPIFLMLYALTFLLFNSKKNQNLYALTAVCVLLATICFLIPNYWYSSIFILGIAHITYGVAVKN